MAVYFFRHGFKPGRDRRGRPIPGRCLFSVDGPSLRREGQTFVQEAPSRQRVCVDGFGDDLPGSNVDPNVFAVELPWFLSFCRSRFHVRDLGAAPGAPADLAPLAEAVEPGDLVVFGDVVGTAYLAVDTVLCVADKPHLPVCPAERGDPCFTLESDFDRYWDECLTAGLARQRMSWDAFVRTPDFILNLADSLGQVRAGRLLGHRRETWHSTADVPVPRQVVGARCRQTERTEVGDLLTRFRSGTGFDFIPLGRPATGRKVYAVESGREGLLIVPYPEAGKLTPKVRPQPKIFRLGVQEGTALITSILGEATRLVHGPLTWDRKSRCRFSYFNTARKPEPIPVPEGWDV